MILIRKNKGILGYLLADILCNHFGAIITGNLFTKSRILSNDALPEPTIIPARKVVIVGNPCLRFLLPFHDDV
jgi:hypothetical protein